MADRPCPLCDIARTNTIDATQAFALGVAVGAAFSDIHSVTEIMCSRHRSPYVVAMAKASIAVNMSGDEEAAAAISRIAEILEDRHG
jgi:hypothetical protein